MIQIVESIVIIILICMIILVRYGFGKELETLKKDKVKVDSLLRLSHAMIISYETNNTAVSFLKKKGLYKIAIYGFGELGTRLMEQIEADEEVTLLYGIDMKAADMRLQIDVYTLEEAVIQEKPDAVIVSTYDATGVIRRNIKEILGCSVLTIEEILYA